MSKDILNQYGPNSSQPQKGSASSGGAITSKDVMGYKPPVGPTSIDNPKTPGIHGTNHGCCGTQGRH